MKPILKDTRFGAIVVNNEELEYDIIIRLSGKVKKRKKKLSKAIFGTSHIISVDEAKYVYQDGAKRLIVGAGRQGMMMLSGDADEFLKEKKCETELFLTPIAIEKWNEATGPVVGLFHVTC